MNKSLSDKLKTVPHNPGCYRFYDKSGRLLYIGKAKNLKKRVSSYFNKGSDHSSHDSSSPRLRTTGASKGKDPKTQVLVGKIADVKWEITDSEMEALILESQLIKKFMPRFNIKIKDDKSFLYVRIDLGQEYPRPEFIRKPRIHASSEGLAFASRVKAKPSLSAEKYRKVKVFGPFTDSGLLKRGMMVLRKIFRWCELSESQIELHRKKGRPCFDYQIEYCSGVCASKISREYYVDSIKGLILFLEGKKKLLIKRLKKEMIGLSSKKDFEKAARVRDKIKALEGMGTALMATRSKLQKPNDKQSSNDQILKNIIKEVNAKMGSRLRLKKDFRIELYDMSNTSGREAVGSMVVNIDGEMARDQYRKFKIRNLNRLDDTAMMREVLSRRLRKLKIKNEKLKIVESAQGGQLEYWPKPDLIILDGGKPQLSVISRLFAENGVMIPLLGLAKEEEEVWGVQNEKLKIKNEKLWSGTLRHDYVRLAIAKDSPEGYFIQRIRDEAHRFGIAFHRDLRNKKVIRSQLDEIVGIGPVTRKKLLKNFGSVRGIIDASDDDLRLIVSEKIVQALKEGLQKISN